MTIAHEEPRTAAAHDEPADPSWNQRVYDVLKGHRVTQVSYVPDAGHTETINRFLTDEDVTTTVLTTEEEGIALSTGAWLGGERSVVLMQSSGVGNCINMLSLPVITRSPFLTLVTMRGEWHEFNPWQMPMGHAVEASLAAVGVHERAPGHQRSEHFRIVQVQNGVMHGFRNRDVNRRRMLIDTSGPSS